jgi:hypothetical protein
MSSSNRVDFLRSNRALSELDFFNLLQKTGKYKKRSEITHDTVHKPLLSQLPVTQIRCLLLGSSMLERFITTGKHTKLGQLAFPNLLNAGVGGDRIQNVVYRLGTKDLFSGLKQRGVKFAILNMGTNNLRRNRGLTGGEIEEYAMVLEALTRAAPDIVVFVTGIMPRADIGSNFVNQSNTDLRQLVQDFNAIGESTQGMPCLNSPHIPMLLYKRNTLAVMLTNLSSSLCSTKSRHQLGQACRPRSSERGGLFAICTVSVGEDG